MTDDKYLLVEEDYDNVDLSFHNAYDSTKEFEKQITSFLSNFKEDDTIFNIGGTLAECRYFLDYNLKVEDIDISKSITDYISSQEPRVKIIKANVKYYDGAKYNGVWACRSLIHIPPEDIDEILIRIHSLLEVKGTFGCILFTNELDEITIDEKPEPHTNKEDTTYYCVLYPTEIIKTKIKKAGFKIVKTENCVDKDGDKAVYIEARKLLI